MIYRQGTVTDAAAIHALVRELAPAFLVDASGAGAELFWDSVSEAAQAQRIASSNHHVIVCEDGDRLVAMIGLRDLSHVYHLFVAAPWQGRGIARELWTRALGYAHAQGHRGDFTVNSSLPAIVVYQRFGFRPAGEVTRSNGVEFLPMRLPAQ